MEENLKEKTGKTLSEWRTLLKPKKFEKHGQYLKFLKEEHGLTHGFANFISMKARAADAGSHDGDQLIVNQYQGKDQLKPIYDEILEAVQKFGSDIEIAPKMKSVSLRRKKQFALVQPTTKTRVDLGLKIKGQEPAGRLESSGPFGAMCTHRIKLESPSQVDKEVLDWLKIAYEGAG